MERCGSLCCLSNPLQSERPWCGGGILSLEAWQRPGLASVSLGHLVGRPFPPGDPAPHCKSNLGYRQVLCLNPLDPIFPIQTQPASPRS